MKNPLLFALLLAAANAGAQQAPGAPQGAERGERRGPPQEAMDACKGKKDGDKVTVRTPRGDMPAVCRLVAVPANPPEPRR